MSRKSGCAAPKALNIIARPNGPGRKAEKTRALKARDVLAMAHLALGYHDEALTSVEKAAAERDPWLVW